MKKRLYKIMEYIPIISNRTKLEISTWLLIFSLVLSFVRPGIDSTICFVAMLLSTLGDFSLNSMPLEKRPPKLMYIGAGFFMVAHLLYATAYLQMIRVSSYNFFNSGAIIAIAFIGLLFIVSAICVSVSKNKLGATMLIVFGVYLFIIGINFVTICSYSYSAKALSFVGALSFLISDFIIGLETVFKIKSDVLRKLVWIFYPIGQLMILACR